MFIINLSEDIIKTSEGSQELFGFILFQISSYLESIFFISHYLQVYKL